MAAVGVVYIAILMPLATWMLKGFFDGIPKDLDDAAMLDGATRLMVVREDHPAGRALGPDRGVRAHRDPGLGRVRHPVHPAQRARRRCRSRSASSTSRAPTRPTRRASWPPAACSPILPAILVFVVAAALHRRRVPRRRAQGLSCQVTRVQAPWSSTWSATPTSTRLAVALAGRRRRGARDVPLGGRPLRRVPGVRLHARRGVALPLGRAARPRAVRRGCDALVRRGQWHVTGSMVVQPDANLPTDGGLAAPAPARAALLRRPLRRRADRRLQRRHVRAPGHPARPPGAGGLRRLRLPPPAPRPRRAPRAGLPLARQRRRRGARLPHRPGLRDAHGRPRRAGARGARRGGPRARAHDVLLRRRQPRRRADAREHRVDPRAPQRRRHRAALLHPGGVLRGRARARGRAARSSRRSCSTRSRAATA